METFYAGCPEEALFFNAVQDLKQHKDDLVLIGGWLPWIYCRYLWKKENSRIFKTNDIDFTVTDHESKGDKTIREEFETKEYYKKHQIENTEEFFFSIDGQDKISMKIDFLKSSYSDDSNIRKIIGNGINVNPMEYMDLMNKPEYHIFVGDLGIKVIKPSLYFYTKGLSFTSRMKTNYKFVKDMWSLYFILTEIPILEYDLLIDEVLGYLKEGDDYFQFFLQNLQTYFVKENALGLTKLTDFMSNLYPREVIRRQIRETFRQYISRLLDGMKKQMAP